jgi:hypothetical protein
MQIYFAGALVKEIHKIKKNKKIILSTDKNKVQ